MHISILQCFKALDAIAHPDVSLEPPSWTQVVGTCKCFVGSPRILESKQSGNQLASRGKPLHDMYVYIYIYYTYIYIYIYIYIYRERERERDNYTTVNVLLYTLTTSRCLPLLCGVIPPTPCPASTKPPHLFAVFALSPPPLGSSIIMMW